MKLYALLCLCAILMAACERKRPSADKEQELLIHVAASLVDVARAIGEDFARIHDVELQFNVASSGTIARQLMASPRGDLFFSANSHWMDEAVRSNTIHPASVKDVLGNRLVVVGVSQNSIENNNSNSLCAIEIPSLCIGDPTYVPVGQYASQWLQSIDCGPNTLWDRVQANLILGMDASTVIAQTIALSESIGIVYYSDYLSHSEELQLLFLLPESGTPEIRYHAGVLTQSEHPELAAAFMDFFMSPQNTKTFESYGFSGLANKAIDLE